MVSNNNNNNNNNNNSTETADQSVVCRSDRAVSHTAAAPGQSIWNFEIPILCLYIFLKLAFYSGVLEIRRCDVT